MQFNWNHVLRPFDLRVDDIQPNFHGECTAATSNCISALRELQEMFEESSANKITIDGRVEKLFDVWKCMTVLLDDAPSSKCSENLDKIYETVTRATLEIILDLEKFDWAQASESRRDELQELIRQFHKHPGWSPDFFTDFTCKNQHATYLLDIFDMPWTTETLAKILMREETEHSELQQFYSNEGCYLTIYARISCLLASENWDQDMALNLVTNWHACAAECVKDDVHDLRFLILFGKRELHELDRDKMTHELELLDRKNAVKFVERLIELKNNTRTFASMEWTFPAFELVVKEAIHITMSIFIGQPTTDSYYQELFDLWAEHCLTENQYTMHMIKYIGDCSSTSAQSFKLTEEIYKKFSKNHLPFCIELFARATTCGINEFSSVNITKEEKRERGKTLASYYIRLAELFPIRIKKECVLTAFTLNPTKELLEEMVNLCVIACNIKKELLSDEENDFNCQNELDPYSDQMTDMISNDDVEFIYSKVPLEEIRNNPKYKLPIYAVNYNILDSPEDINNDIEQMGLSKSLADDILILLVSPRQSNTMSWKMDVEELRTACTEFMLNFETQFDSMKLNYLEVDYSQFENMPVPEFDEYSGIEKGYEEFLEAEEAETIEEPVRKKPKKKSKHSEENVNYDHLYSSSDESTSISHKKSKKKSNQRKRSSSDSDFEPSASKKPLKKQKEKKPIVKIAKQVAKESKVRPKKKPTKPKVIVTKPPVLKISLLRLIRKPSVSKTSSVSSLINLKLLDEDVKPEINSIADKSEVTDMHMKFAERNKYFELSVRKVSETVDNKVAKLKDLGHGVKNNENLEHVRENNEFTNGCEEKIPGELGFLEQLLAHRCNITSIKNYSSRNVHEGRESKINVNNELFKNVQFPEFQKSTDSRFKNETCNSNNSKTISC